MTVHDPHELLITAFRAGVAAADPQAATRQAVISIDNLDRPVWVIAAGKGAHRMASGAVEALQERNVAVAGGIVVGNEPDPESTHRLESVVGDHPTPGHRSFAAADRLDDVAARTTGDADAIVLISGGGSSLIAAPIPGLPEEALQQAFSVLLGSGADIGLMNAVRKRLLRFGAGRLALALGTRNVHCLIASDVIGNDPADIASGLCVPDRGTARETRDRLRAVGAWDALPSAVRQEIDAMAEGRVPDVPPADHPRFATTFVAVILDRTHAERGAAEAARQLGEVVEVESAPLSGDAAVAGRRFASRLLARRRQGPGCIVWSGETTVTLGSESGPGGRCQEFALACALQLEEAGEDRASGITVLAAGTDGRDGPTDAAGAIVDATTSERVRRSGIDPAEALRTHASYGALQAADALLKTGPTGTNVNDLVVALCQ